MVSVTTSGSWSQYWVNWKCFGTFNLPQTHLQILCHFMAEAITSPPSGGYSPVYGGDQKGDQPNLLINTWNRLESDMVTKYSKLNNSKHGLWLDLKTVIWICIFFCCLLRGKINSQQIFSNTYLFSFKDAMLLTLSPGFSNDWNKMQDLREDHPAKGFSWLHYFQRGPEAPPWFPDQLLLIVSVDPATLQLALRTSATLRSQV